VDDLVVDMQAGIVQSRSGYIADGHRPDCYLAWAVSDIIFCTPMGDISMEIMDRSRIRSVLIDGPLESSHV
jgi:hypothetical protein